MEHEVTTIERLPVFVYGTLRPEQGNTWAWEDTGRPNDDGLWRVPGYGLWTGGGFPYALPTPEAWATGCLIEAVSDQCFTEMIEAMDHLEGYPHHYDRLKVTAIHADGTTADCWMYVPNPDRQAWIRAVKERVPGDDWLCYTFGGSRRR